MKSHMKKSLSVLLSFILCMAMLMSVSAMSTDVVPETAAGKAMTLTVSGEVLGNEVEEINQILGESSITVSGEIAEQVKATLKLVVSGAELFTVRTAADAENFLIEIPQVFSNSILINYEALMNNLGSQLQGILEGMNIDLDELLGEFSSSVTNPSLINEDVDYEDIFAPYAEIIMGSVQECTTVTSDTEITFKYGIDTLTGDVYTWAPTAEQFADLCVKFGTLMKEDDRLIEVYRDALEMERPYFSMFASLSEDMTEEDLEEAYTQINEIIDQLPDMLVENAEEYGQVLAALALQVNIGVVDGTPVAAVLSLDTEGGAGLGEILSIGYENADGDYYFYFDQAGEDYALKASFDETEEDATFRADVLAGGFSVCSFTLTVSKTDITRLGIPAVFADLEIGTSFSASMLLSTYDDEDIYTVTVEGIDTFTGSSDITGFTVTSILEDESSVEDIELDSIDVSGYTAEEFGQLFEQIGQGFTQYFGGAM